VRDHDLTSIAMQKAALARRCPDCGDRMINEPAHLERCTGRPFCRIPSCRNRAKHQPLGLCDPHYHEARTEACDCPAGWKHLPDCIEVTGGEAA